MYVATIQCLKYSGQEFKLRNLHFVFLTQLLTLKLGQGHQTQDDNVDLKQYYTNAKCPRNAKVRGFSNEEIC